MKILLLNRMNKNIIIKNKYFIINTINSDSNINFTFLSLSKYSNVSPIIGLKGFKFLPKFKNNSPIIKPNIQKLLKVYKYSIINKDETIYFIFIIDYYYF